MAPSCRGAVTLALLLHDLAWVSFVPEAGVLAMLAGLVLQAKLVREEQAWTFEFANELSLLLWLLGNIVWSLSEYTWCENEPAGFLNEITALHRLRGPRGTEVYALCMSCAVAEMLATSVGLSLFYLARWVRRPSKQHPGNGLFPCALGGRADGKRSMADPLLTAALGEETYVGLRCLTLPVYYEFFTLPWVIMDTSWGVCNLLGIWHYKPPSSLFFVAGTAGAVAIAVQSDCVRRRLSERNLFETALNSAELLWLTGNMLWMFEDILTNDTCFSARHAVMLMFVAGGLLTVGAMFLNEDPQTQVAAAAPRVAWRDVDAASMRRPGPAVDVAPPQRRPGGLAGIDERAVAAAPFLDAACSKTPWRRAGRPRRIDRLAKGVTILRRAGVAEGKCPLEHAVALALRDLGGGSRHPRPILLLDLGRVSRALAAWRSELPRLVPQFPVGQDADRKTVQLLHAERCCFTCTTLPEIRLALSLGISPKDIFFAQPRKPRPHLSFAREHGVELMTFEDEAELQKVAAEHAGARLLLSVACSEERGGSAESPPFAVRFGAQRDSWRPLLELAAGLGLSVVGVSLSCGPRRASCPGEALGAAREAMSLAVACGFEVTVLEVGGAFAALAGGGQAGRGAEAAQSADDVEGHLRRRFPSAAWPGLRILAEPGRHVAQGAVALLTPGRAPLAGGSERCSPSGGRWGTFGSPCAVDWSGEDMPAVSSPSTRWLLWQALPTGSPSDGTAAWRAAPPAAAPPVPQPQLPTAAPTVWYFSEEEVS